MTIVRANNGHAKHSPMTASLLAERGFVPCWCGAARKRTAGPWGCWRRGCDDFGRGGLSKPAGATAKASPAHPSPSKPMPGRHARGNAVCDALAESMRLSGIPSVEREFRFHPVRRWRFDIAARAHSLAVEVDGGAFTGGHSRGKAYEAECLKFCEAAILGWRVLRVTPQMVKSGQALALIRRAVGGGA